MRFALELVACTFFYLLGVRSGHNMLKSKLDNWIRNRNIELSHNKFAHPADLLALLADVLRNS